MTFGHWRKAVPSGAAASRLDDSCDIVFADAQLGDDYNLGVAQDAGAGARGCFGCDRAESSFGSMTASNRSKLFKRLGIPAAR
jgi:hypothetical protein